MVHLPEKNDIPLYMPLQNLHGITFFAYKNH